MFELAPFLLISVAAVASSGAILWLLGPKDIAQPLVFIVGFFSLIFVVRPYFLVRYAPLALPPGSEKAIILGSVGLVTASLGYIAPVGVALANTATAGPNYRYSSRRLYSAALLILLISTLAAWGRILYLDVRVVEVFRDPLEALIQGQGTGAVVFATIASWSALAAYVMVLGYATGAIRRLVPVAVTVIAALAILFSLGLRWPLVSIFLVPLLACHYSSETNYRVSLSHLASAAVVLVIVLLGLNQVRHGYDIYSVRPLAVLSNLTPFDDFARLIKAVPESLDYQWGESYLYRITGLALVPRALWPGKPIIAPEFIFTRQIYGPGAGTTHTFTVFGDFYLQAGTVGILVGSALYGMFWRFVYEYQDRRADSIFAVVFCTMLIVWGISNFRSNFGGLLVRAASSGIILWLAARWSRLTRAYD